MSQQIKISEDLSVDAVEYASRANAILGIRDSGKTFTATLIAEQLFECRIPFFAFDPIGRWRFLKSPAAGHPGRGFPIVVAGGAVPDLPLTPASAPDLIRAAMRSGVSMVIDLYSIGLSKADWRAIVRHSIETILYEGDGFGQRHVFLEEAAEFIPQHVRDGQTYAAVEKLARMGGNVGVGVTLINQRAEEVNKAVLELCDNLLLHRQRGKNSLLSLRKWLEAGNVKPPKEITDSLADLPTGQLWAWFKDLGRPRLVQVSKKQSFDPNRRQMAQARSRTPNAVDVSAFVAQMKDALAGKKTNAKVSSNREEEKDVKESEAKALRAENAELKRRVDELAKMAADQRKAKDAQQEFVADEVAFGPAPNTSGTFPDMDAIYAEVKRRAQADPGVLATLRQRPEIEVVVERKRIEATEKTLLGRLAVLISEGFFDEPTSANKAFVELKRRGVGVAVPSVYRECDKLTMLGFLTKESGGYKTVPGMKVNVVQQ